MTTAAAFAAFGPGHRFNRIAIRLARHGCANRPFFHIVVIRAINAQKAPPIEQLGTFDPLVNENNEHLLAVNMDRLKYWLGQNPKVSRGLLTLLGTAGYFPIHPRNYMRSWRRRYQFEEEKAAADKKAAEEAAKEEENKEKPETE